MVVGIFYFGLVCLMMFVSGVSYAIYDYITINKHKRRKQLEILKDFFEEN